MDDSVITTRKALREVHEIIMNSEQEIQDRIPERFMKLLEENEDKEYIPRIDFSKDINEQVLLEDTRDILAMVYTDYICNEEERKDFFQKKEKILKEENEKYYVYKKMKKRATVVETKNTSLAEIRKEKWYTKVINFIRGIING